MRERVQRDPQATVPRDAGRRAAAGVERLLQRWRPYAARRFGRRERRVEAAAAAGLVAVAVALPLVLPSNRPFDPAVALALVATLAVASRVRLYLGAGYAMPTQLALVPMLFLLPATSVPALVACALMLPALADGVRGGGHPERMLTGLADAWHAVGPALVFVAAGEPGPALGSLPLLGVALLAQSATDMLAATAREWLGRGINPAVQSLVMLSVYGIDACLTPIALLVAIAAAAHPAAIAFALPLLALLAALAFERRARIQEAVAAVDELSEQHRRLDRAIGRIGEAFASKLDRGALADIVLRTAAEALDAEYGRVALAGTPQPAVAAAEALAAAEETARRSGELEVQTRGEHVAVAHPLAAGEDAEVLVLARRGSGFTDEEQVLLASLANQTAVALENVALHDRLRRQATVDELTGLANHRRFQDALAEEVARTRRSGRPLALALLDLDDFKAVNDTHGHRQGDLVLQAVAGAIRAACRSTDEPARYGGEELAVVLPETDLDGAFTIAESIRRAVEALRVPLRDGSSLQVTVSIGVSALSPTEDDPGVLIEAADVALYEAKRSGKNRTRRGGWAGTSAARRFARAAGRESSHRRAG